MIADSHGSGNRNTKRYVVRVFHDIQKYMSDAIIKASNNESALAVSLYIRDPMKG